MNFSRRDFVHAICTIVTATLVPSVVDRAEAAFHGSNTAPVPIYSQAMGATDASGLLVSLPLSPTAGSIYIPPPATPTLVLSATGSINTSGTTPNQYTVGTIFAGVITVGQKLFTSVGGQTTYYGQVLNLVSGSGQISGSVWQLDTTTGGAVIGSVQVTAAPGARAWFCDTVNANGTYNGLSPYPGYRLNGTGTYFQYGATGPGVADSTYGPLPSFLAAFFKVTANANFNTGNQIFLAQSQTFSEGGAIANVTFNGTTTVTINSVSYGYIEPGLYLFQVSNQQILSQVFPLNVGETVGGSGRYIMSAIQAAATTTVAFAPTSNNGGTGLNNRYGESIAYPWLVSSYDNTGVVSSPPTATNAVNLLTQGRATGTNRPTILTDPLPTTFLASTSGSSTTVTIQSGSLLGSAAITRGGQILTGPGVPSNCYTVSATSTTLTLNIPVTLSAGSSCSLSGSSNISQLFSNGQGLNPFANGVGVLGNWAVRGINFTGTNQLGNDITLSSNAYNILFENCTFAFSGLGIGQSSGTGALNGRNVIIRHCGVWQNAVNSGGHGASGIGYGYTDAIVVENCVVWRGGWTPDILDRQSGYVTSASLASSGVLTLNSSLSGSVVPGGPFVLGSGSGGGGVSGFIISGSGTTWQTTITGSTFSALQCVFSSNLAGPTIFDHGLYGAIGANIGSSNVPLVRRCVFVDCSASGFSARGSANCYNCIFIDNPVPTFAGGQENSGNFNVCQFTASFSGSVMTVTALTSPQPYLQGALIVPGQNCALSFTGITGTPYVVSQVLPLIGGETLGGIGRYNTSSAQSTLTGVTVTTISPGYAGETPAGAVWNYHDSLVMGANDITISSFGFRHNGIGVNTGGAAGSSMARHLFINNNKYGNSNSLGTNVFVFANSALYDVPSFNDLLNNSAFSFNDILEQPNTQPFPAELLTTYGNNQTLTVSSATYNSGTGVVSLTLSATAPFSTGATISVNLSASTGINYPTVTNKSYVTTSVSGTNVQFNIGTGLSLTIGSGTIGYSPSPGTNTVNTNAIVSGNYNDLTGVITLTVSASVPFTVGNTVAIGSLTGAASIANVNSASGVSSVASGTAVTFQATPGLIGNSSATNAITGGNMGYTKATNAQIYAMLQSQGYGDGTRNGLAAQMAASPELNWAYTVLQTVGPMFNNFPFQYS